MWYQIRVQLESLLAEKARLAHENSVYARENRFLREIVEYHQLSMQDVVYLDEGAEEVTEIGYPINFPYSKMLCESPLSPSEVVEVSPSSFPWQAQRRKSCMPLVQNRKQMMPPTPTHPHLLRPIPYLLIMEEQRRHYLLSKVSFSFYILFLIWLL